jgi:rsbT co-antagonist protein RsbR
MKVMHMLKRFQSWQQRLPIEDEVEQQQGFILQVVLLGWITLLVLGLAGLIIKGPPPASTQTGPQVDLFGPLFLSGILIAISPIVALIVLRRGHVRSSVAVAAYGILIAHSFATYILGIADATVTLNYQIPLALAGLLGGRRLLVSVASINISVYTLVGLLQYQTPRLAGFMGQTSGLSFSSLIGFFIVVTLLLTLLLDRTSVAHRQSMVRARLRETELQQIRASLEERVSERTTALEQALREVQTRSTEQTRLIERINQQQATIQDLSVPVIPIDDDTLVMPLVGTLDSERLALLQNQGLAAIEQTHAHTLIVDITGVPIIDIQVGHRLVEMMQAVRLLGGEVLIVGVRPEVAQTIVGLGIDLHDMRSFSSLQSALANIRSTHTTLH